MLRIPDCTIIDACTVSKDVIAVATSAGLFVLEKYQQDAEVYQITNYKKFVSCVRPLAEGKFAAVFVDYKESSKTCEL